MRRRQEDAGFHIGGIAERLTPYETAAPPHMDAEQADEELVERAATLLAVMPGAQKRTTIEQLLSPHDAERGRKAVEALIEAHFAIEDASGRLRRFA